MNADQYVEHWENRKIWTHLERPKHRARLAECAKNLKGETFADIGCAYGHSTAIMAETKPGKWYGVDFSQRAIDKAGEHSGDKGIDFVYAINSAALGIEMYDSIVCSEVIEHVENDREFVMDIIGAARNVAVFTTPNKRVNDPGHLRLYDKAMLKELFHGFATRIFQSGIFWFIIVEK